ncbi:MAG: hypothetical protein HW416_2592, partial [Chloroflexi bacterium]|nr:hypothetical protein [Chloroflexota bacterium]
MEPESLHPKFSQGSGAAEFDWIFSSTLTIQDFQAVAHPVLAEEIPTQSNGMWVVNPDGTMTTTYRLREGARWHDGTPLTAQDFVFAHEVYVDPGVPAQ